MAGVEGIYSTTFADVDETLEVADEPFDEPSVSEGAGGRSVNVNCGLDYGLTRQKIIDRMNKLFNMHLWANANKIPPSKAPAAYAREVEGIAQPPSPQPTVFWEDEAAHVDVLVVVGWILECWAQGDIAMFRSGFYEARDALKWTMARWTRAYAAAAQVLKVPRWELGALFSRKGLITGAITIKALNGESWKPSMLTPVFLIPGDVSEARSFFYELPVGAHIVVIEKDTILEALYTAMTDDEKKSVVLITGKGVPDVATRATLHKICAQNPTACVWILVDGGYSGPMIATTYKLGSSMPGSEVFAVPKARYLGVTDAMLVEMGRGSATPNMDEREITGLSNLQSRLSVDGHNDWIDELEFIKQRRIKVDLDVVKRKQAIKPFLRMLLKKMNIQQDTHAG